MPHTFIQVGLRWINLDLVTSIQMVPDPRDSAKLIAACVQYTTGKYHDFKAPAEIQTVADWLESHKAP